MEADNMTALDIGFAIVILFLGILFGIALGTAIWLLWRPK